MAAVMRGHNLILIGPMGAGKTSIGRRVAAALKMTFVDSDCEIEKRTGVDIPTIFEFEGEEGFRTRETAVLREICTAAGIVLATGGGAVLREENRALLKDCGFVVYLRTSVATQLRRTARDRNRPLLQTENPRARLEALMTIRGPIYEALADFAVDTDGQVMRNTIRKLVAAFEAYRAEASADH